MAYVVKRSNRHGAERFTGMYKAADGTYKSAGTFDTPERAQRVAEASEQHALAQLTSTSPADKATVTLAEYLPKFLADHDIELNSKEEYARQIRLHVLPYIGGQRVAEVWRETIHRLLTVVLKEDGATQNTILHTRTALSSMSWRPRISSCGSTTRCPLSRLACSRVWACRRARGCAS